MYAIVEIAGQQYKVQKDQQIFVHRLEGEEGSKVEFGNVLLTGDGEKIQVGAPAVKGVSVSAKIIEHLKGDKVIVFKKKRRKGYKVRNGHRQYLTKIEISGIGSPSSKTKATSEAKPESKESKKVEAPKAAPKPAEKVVAKKPTEKAETKVATPKAEAPKAAAPKAEAKKAPAKSKETKTDKKEDKA